MSSEYKSRQISGEYDAIVIGGGFYGCSLALFLAKRYRSVAILEKEDDLLTRSSYVNQARVHGGYHYPRSFTTALRSLINMPRFLLDFRDCIDDSFKMIYAIARQDTKSNAFQFRKFCERIGAPISPASSAIKQLFDYKMIEDVFMVQEYAFDASRLRAKMQQRLEEAKVDVRLSQQVLKMAAVDGGLKLNLESGFEVFARQVYNCTYSQINHLLESSELPALPMKHEITEVALVQLPDELQGYGVTVMDGPFFSSMPFPARDAYSFTHVRYTPHENWVDSESSISDPHKYLQSLNLQSNFAFMLKDAQRYMPILAHTKYLSSLYEVKTVLVQNEQDDGRPILLRSNYGLNGLTIVMGGKIDNIYDVLQALNEIHSQSQRS